MALVVDDQQPLTIELSFSGNKAKIDRLREEGIVDDFMVMVDSAKAIPYDPANVEPPLAE